VLVVGSHAYAPSGPKGSTQHASMVQWAQGGGVVSRTRTLTEDWA